MKGDTFAWIEEMPRVGLEILTAQGDQASRKLYLCWGAHHQDAYLFTHMWCETNLGNPEPKGSWSVNGINPYNTNDYMFEVPGEWAEQFADGLLLEMGRYRDDGWSRFGPSLFAIAPWNHGNPPPDGTILESILLIVSTQAGFPAAQFFDNRR